MHNRSSKRPTDPSQLAKLMVDIASGEVDDALPEDEHVKNAAAVALGRLGGKKGGKARSENLSPQRRSEIAKIAASARWKKDDE